MKHNNFVSFKEQRQFYDLCVKDEPYFFCWWKLGKALGLVQHEINIAFNLYNIFADKNKSKENTHA